MPLISRYLTDLIRIRLMPIVTVALRGKLWLLMDGEFCFKGFLTPLSYTIITLYNFYIHFHTSTAGRKWTLPFCSSWTRFCYWFCVWGCFGWCGRFDIEGDDDETQANFTSQERTQIPSSLIPSPPLPSEPQKRKQQNDASTTYKTESWKMHHIGRVVSSY